VRPEKQMLNMMLFVQVGCGQSKEMIESKNVWGLAAACIGLLISFTFSLTIQYLYRTDKIDEKLADLALVTIDDYATQTRLPKGLYQEYLNNRRGELTDDHIPINEFTAAMGAAIKQ
jgi:hypothetical protein